MPQLLIAILVIVVIKLLMDAARPARNNRGRSEQGDFIDISEKWIQADNMPYRKKETLLDDQALPIWNLLKEILAGSRFEIFPRVRLADLLLVPPATSNRKEYQFRINERSVDLLVVDQALLKPLAGIILASPGTSQTDLVSAQYTARALAAAGLECITYKLDTPPSRETLAGALRKAGIDL